MQPANEIIMIPVSELRAYENNPRFNDKAVKAVADSIEAFGFRVPILIDKNNVIIAGHTRLKAALKLDIQQVPCIRCGDLTPEQVKALRIVDNRTAEFSEWDTEKLNKEIADILNGDEEFPVFRECFPDFDTIDVDKQLEAMRKESEQDAGKPNMMQCPYCGEWFEVTI